MNRFFITGICSGGHWSVEFIFKETGAFQSRQFRELWLSVESANSLQNILGVGRNVLRNFQ
jgi:hypothetical protein